MSTHNMFLWRNVENYPSFTVRYSPYLLPYTVTVVHFLDEKPKAELRELPKFLSEVLIKKK